MTWEPIGNSSQPFTGSLDGNGYTIRNLKVDQGNKSYQGLFGYATGATIRNLHLSNVDVKGSSYVGALAGHITLNFTIDNVSVESGTVRGTSYVGGIVGYGHTGTVQDSWSTAGVEATTQYAGGIAGYSYFDLLTSYVNADVKAGTYGAGGLIGTTPNGAKKKIENSFALGMVRQQGTGSAYIGGLVGSAGSSTQIINSYVSTKLDYKGKNYIGGLTGTNVAVTSSYYDQDIAGGSFGIGGKSTSTMMTLETFVGWDFNSIWELKPDSYPRLRIVPIPDDFRLLSRTDHSISLTWTAVPEATGYELEIDRERPIPIGNVTAYMHEPLDPGSRHYYRIRATIGAKKGNYSKRVTAYTLLNEPSNFTIREINGSLHVSWSPVVKATGYLIEVNGERVQVGETTSYVLDMNENEQYAVRIRAENEFTVSTWTAPQSYLNWANSGVGICLCQTVNEDSATAFVITAKNMKDIYTLHAEFEYLPSELIILAEEAKSLIGEGEMYSHLEIDEDAGMVKAIISDVGDKNNDSGITGLLKFSFQPQSTWQGVSKIQLKKLVLANHKGEYLTTAIPAEFNLWIAVD